MPCLLRFVNLAVISMLFVKQIDAKSWECGDKRLKHRAIIYHAEDIDANMAGLGVGQECELLLSEYMKLELRIYLNATDQVESCGVKSNQLIIRSSEIGSAKEVLLLCGTKKIELMELAPPVRLVFRKVSSMSKLQRFRLNFLRAIQKYYSYMSYTRKSLEISNEPRFSYPIYYPQNYSGAAFSIKQQVKNNTILFSQLRYIIPQKCWYYNQPSKKFVRPSVMFCADFFLFVTWPYDERGVDFQRGSRHELDYQAVKENEPYRCTESKTRHLIVKEPFYFSYNLYGNGLNSPQCNVILTAASPDMALKISNVSSSKTWRNVVSYLEFQIFVGDKEIKPSRSYFGVIQGMRNQSITVSIKMKGTYTDSIGFVVELVDLDNPPVEYIALHTPSYIWISSDYMGENYGFNVRPPVQHTCVQFTTLKEDLTPREGGVAEVVSLFRVSNVVSRGCSLSGSEGIFELTKDCFGNLLESTIINNNVTRTTYVVPKTMSHPGNDTSADTRGFWLKFIRKDDGPCEAGERELSRPNLNSSVKDLFDRIDIKQYMSCGFIIPKGSSDIKFRGFLEDLPDAYLIVKEDYYPFANLNRSASHNWFYSSRNIYIYFKTGEVICDDMTSFEYGLRYKNGIGYTFPACPGPQNIIVSNSSTLTTPDYPNYLTSNLSCSWILKRPVNFYENIWVINVTIPSWVMAPCHSSTKLYISSDLTVNKRLCGTKQYAATFTDDTVKVDIIGGADNVLKGIKIDVAFQEMKYTRGCNKEHNIVEGGNAVEVIKWLQPGKFHVPFQCWMKFNLESQQDVLLFHLQHVNLDRYTRNVLRVYDGSRKYDRQLIGRVYQKDCSSDCETSFRSTCFMNCETFLSSSNQITIDLSIVTPRDSTLNVGFSVQPLNGGSCPNKPLRLNAISSSRLITSLNYPIRHKSPPPTNMDCTWMITSDEADPNIVIEILNLDLDLCTHCDENYLEIYSYHYSSISSSSYYHYWRKEILYSSFCPLNSTTLKSGLVPALCGSLSETRKINGTRKLFIHFKTNSSESHHGFKLHYYTQKPQDESEGEDEADDKTGVIVGTVLPLLFCMIGITGVVVWCLHKKKKKPRPSEEESNNNLGWPFMMNAARQQPVHPVDDYNAEPSSSAEPVSTTQLPREGNATQPAQLPNTVNEDASEESEEDEDTVRSHSPNLSDIFMMVHGNTEPPPSYPSIIREGFPEEPPPSYNTAYIYIVPPSPSPSNNSTQNPPPPYHLSRPLNQGAVEQGRGRRQNNEDSSQSPGEQSRHHDTEQDDDQNSHFYI